jgi:hypothetical protein
MHVALVLRSDGDPDIEGPKREYRPPCGRSRPSCFRRVDIRQPKRFGFLSATSKRSATRIAKTILI